MRSSHLSQMASSFREEDSFTNDLDPMLEGGYRVIYLHQCPFEIRQKSFEDGEKQIGTKDILNVRILALLLSEDYSDLKVEISSESDLFMVMEEKIDEKKFNWIRKQQGLNFSFSMLAAMLSKQFNLCDKHPEQYSLVLYLNPKGNNSLTILENIEYKNIQLICLQLRNIGEQLLKEYISFRYNAMRGKNAKIQLKTKEMLGLVKLKNPNLLQTIIKKGQNPPTTTTMLLNSTRTSR